jgi:glycosyltransferase involved in cell wall biosynthesis
VAASVSKKYKVAYLISHPIQYMSPLFRAISKDQRIDLTVYYCSDEVLGGYKDVGFGKEINWDVPLLKGHKYVFLKNHSPINTIYKFPFGLINFGIIPEITRNNYDILIVSGWNYVTYWLAFLMGIFGKTKLYIRGESPLNQEILKPKWNLLIKKIVLKYVFKRINFFAIGTENSEFYKACGISSDKIFLMPYSTDNEKFLDIYARLKDKKVVIRKELGIPADKIVVMFAGKFIDKKRPIDALKAYGKINDENAALIFVGDGDLRGELEDYVKEKKIKDVYFLGFKNLKIELPKCFIAADIYIACSTVGDTWGLSANLAMCFHLPLIVSDMLGCGKDLVMPGENGFIYKTGDIDELADCLKRILDDKRLRETMGERSFEIIKKWNHDLNIKGLIEALKTVGKSQK